jgi:ribosomal protein S27AE
MSDGHAAPGDGAEGDVDPAEAFALLADANRFDLVRVLVEAERDSLPFGELYERSNFDDSGQFNYHLDRLVGPFVRRTAGRRRADGSRGSTDGRSAGEYEPRHAALIVYRLAVSGLLSDRAEAEVTALGTACPRCGTGELVAVYEGDRFWVRCRDCGRRAAVGPFPPRALANHDPERIPAAFDRYAMGLVVRAVENVCPWCASPLSASLERADEGWPAVDWIVYRSCRHCRGWIVTRVHDLLRLHPGVVAFYRGHGVDVLGSTFWDAEASMADRTVVVDGTDEWAARVTLSRDGDELELGLAEDLRASTAEVLGPGP